MKKLQSRLRVVLLGLSLIATSFSTSVPHASAAATVALEASADAYVDSAASNVNTNYGTATPMKVKGDSAAYSTNRIIYLSFDISSIQNAASATLHIKGYNAQQTKLESVYAYETANGWTESSITWSNKPGKIGSSLSKIDVAKTVTSASPVYYDLDVTKAVRDSLLSGNTTVSIMLECTDNNSNGLEFYSKESSAGNHPQLIVDTTPQPPVWNNPQLTATDDSPTALTIHWTPASDWRGVTGYQIYQDGTSIGTVTGNVYSYSIANLNPNQVYTFKVEAGNADGLWTTNGPSISSTPPPVWPGSKQLTVSNVAETSLTLNWTPATDSSGVTSYKIYQNGVPVATVAGNVYTFAITGLSAATNYTFKVEAGNSSNRWTTDGPGATAATPAALVVSLTPTADSYVESGNANTNYGINGSLVVKGDPNNTARKAYLRFDLSGVNYASNAKLRLYGHNEQSESAVPVYIYAAADNWTESQLSWSNAPATLGTAVNTSSVGTTTWRWYEFDVTNAIRNEIVNDGVITLVVACNTDAGQKLVFNSKENPNTATLPQLVIDQTPAAPVWPAQSQVTVTDIQETSVALQWTPAKDKLGVTGYKVYQDGKSIADVAGNVYSLQVTGLTTNSTYQFKVEAGNAGGSSEVWSTDGPSISIKVNTLPHWPIGSALTVSQQGETGMTLNWPAAVDSDGIASYKVLQNGTELAVLPANALTYDVTGLTSDTAYNFTVLSYDGMNWSSTGLSLSASTIKVPVSGVSVDPSALTMAIGTTKQLVNTVSPSNASHHEVTWKSSNSAVVSVSPNGLLTAAGLGNAVITLTTVDGGFTAAVDVSVVGATLALNKNVTYQTIEGFGIAANDRVDQLRNPANFTPDMQKEILDRLFGTNGQGLGMSMVRMEVNPYLKSDPDPTNALQATFEPQEGVFDWDTDLHQKWFAQEAIKRGANRFYAVPWSPPAWMKTNNSEKNGGTLRADKLPQFADYFKQYVVHYANTDGINIGWLSIQNEPDLKTAYASSQYNPFQLQNALNAVADRFHADDVWTKVFMPEGSTFDASYPYVASMDEKTTANLDGIAYHGYSKRDFNGFNSYGKPVWMTEVSYTTANDATIKDGIQWAQHVANSMNMGDNAYFYWWGVANDTSGQHVIQLKPGTGTQSWTYSVPKRGYSIGQFSRFVRPGYQRIEAAANNDQIQHVAFKDPATNKLVLVVINGSGVDYTPSISGFTETNAKVYRTSSSEDMAPLSDIAISNGSFTYLFPANSVTTIVEDVTDNGAPGDITDLVAKNSHDGNVSLQWRAPGDTASLGTANHYEIRISTSPITEADFNAADVVKGAPSPQSAGQLQSYLITGLNKGTTYYFAMKTYDEAGHASGISNIAQISTPDAAADVQIPTAPSNLTVTDKSEAFVQLAWAASTDDTGVAGYDIYDGQTLVASTADTSYTITGLTPQTSHTYTVYAKDATGNRSLPSRYLTVWNRTEIVRPALDDAYIRGFTLNQPGAPDYSNTKFGVTDPNYLEVKGAPDASYIRKAYLKFDISNLDSIHKATFRLYGANTDILTYNPVAVHVVALPGSAVWSDDQITWNNAPPASGGNTATQSIGKAFKYYDFDVTSLVQEHKQLGESMITFLLEGDENFYLKFNSSENSENQPQLVIEPTVATGIALNKSSLSLSMGTSDSLVASVTPDDATDKRVLWTTSDAAVATVDAAGVVTAGNAGTATVTASTYNNLYSASAKIQVVSPPVVVETAGITLNKSNVNLAVGASETLVATVTPSDATDKRVKWKTSDEAVATVDAVGAVTAKKAGKATITATTNDNKWSATVTVTVIQPVTPSGPSVPPIQIELPPINIDPLGIKLGGTSISVKTETDADGKKVLKVEILNSELKKALDALKINTQVSPKIIVEVKESSDIVRVALPAAAFKDVSKPGTVVSIVSKDVAYDLPVSLIQSASAKLGSPQDQVTVQVNMEKVTSATADKIAKKAAEQNLRLLADTYDFSITAESGGRIVEIDRFIGTYVTRSIQFPKAANVSKMTGVVIDPASGTASFVPTVFETADGKTIARMKRQSNSMYTIVESDKTFADLNGHWSKADVDMLASKLVVQGISDQSFGPEKLITRAEFAALLVRSLGLAEEQETAAFADVSGDSWYAGVIGAAVKAGLANGYDNQTFRPDGLITREEMAVMVMRATAIAGKTEQAVSGATTFGDELNISTWAKQAVTQAAGAGIIQGMTDRFFAPRTDATRAQATAMLKRFLQYVQFIN